MESGLHHIQEHEEGYPLILFSGGLDSSFLLQEELRKGDVKTIYVKSSQHPNKIEMELRARKKIIKTLEKITGNKVMEDFIITLDIPYGYPSYRFVQPSLWLMGALQVTQSYMKFSSLKIAYVMGDQISSHLDDIQSAWNSLQKFSSLNKVDLEFPFRYTTKQTILKGIIKEVRDKIWVCESPIKKPKSVLFLPCEECGGCCTHAAALYTEKESKKREIKNNRKTIEVLNKERKEK